MRPERSPKCSPSIEGAAGAAGGGAAASGGAEGAAAREEGGGEGGLGALPAQSRGAPPQREHPAAVRAEQLQPTDRSVQLEKHFVKTARAPRTTKDRGGVHA
jgi:hypothetical protein